MKPIFIIALCTMLAVSAKANAGWHTLVQSSEGAMSYSDGVAAGGDKRAFSMRISTARTVDVMDYIADCHDGTLTDTGGKSIGLTTEPVIVPASATTPFIAAPGSVLDRMVQIVCQ